MSESGRYLLFASSTWDIGGGWDDFVGRYESEEEAETGAHQAAQVGNWYDWWWHVVDLKTGQIVRKGVE